MIHSMEQRIKELERANEVLKRSSQGATIQSHPTERSSLSTSFWNSVQLMLMKELEPYDDHYANAFVDFVESLIQEGDPETKILAVLIKHGGKGPLVKVKEKTQVSQFDFHVSQLIHKGLIQIEGDLVFINSREIVPTSDLFLEDLDLPQMFDEIKEIAMNGSDELVAKSLEQFRDELQRRDVPATTVFFAIRKLAEAVRKGTATKKEIITQIDEWAAKILGGNP